MRRTQLYLEDDLWNALHAQARSDGTSISHLVREAVRDRYLGKLDERRKAMQAFVGIRGNREDVADTETYVRNLRRSQRLDKLYQK
jgi:6-phosphogluconate dehydrogenase